MPEVRSFLAALLFLVILWPEVSLSDQDFLRRRGQKRGSHASVQTMEKGSGSGKDQPHTAGIMPACVFRLVERIDRDGSLVSDRDERVPLAGIRLIDAAEAARYLETNVKGAWVKICHPSLRPMGKSLQGIIYIEPRLAPLQEELVKKGLARIGN